MGTLERVGARRMRRRTVSPGRRPGLRAALGLAALALAGGCGPDPDADLRAAAHAMLWNAAPLQLQRSQFTVIFPNGTPTQYVSYAFSSLGSSEWPERQASVDADPALREVIATMRMPLLPDGVAITHLAPKPELGRQLVLVPDDARGLLVVEGYADPAEPPVVRFEQEFRVPELHPSQREILEAIARANLETGASAQAF